MDLRVEIVKSTNIFGNFTNTFLMTKWIGKVSKTIGDISVTIDLNIIQNFMSAQWTFCFPLPFPPSSLGPSVLGGEDWVYTSSTIRERRGARGLLVWVGTLGLCWPLFLSLVHGHVVLSCVFGVHIPCQDAGLNVNHSRHHLVPTSVAFCSLQPSQNFEA